MPQQCIQTATFYVHGATGTREGGNAARTRRDGTGREWSDAPSLTVFFFQDAFCCSLLLRRSIAFRRTDGRGLPSSPLITGMNVSVGSKALT